MTFTITARCGRGHTQDIKVDGALGLEWATEQAALLDGTSKLYKYPPTDCAQSVIGKCGICGTPIRCTVAASTEPQAGENKP